MLRGERLIALYDSETVCGYYTNATNETASLTV